MIKIIQGEKQEITIQLGKKEGSVTKPYNLTGNTEIKVCFKHKSGLVSKLKTTSGVVVVGADTDGKIKATLLVADTDAMSPGSGDIEVVEDKGSGNITRFQIPNAFQAIAKICP